MRTRCGAFASAATPAKIEPLDCGFPASSTSSKFSRRAAASTCQGVLFSPPKHAAAADTAEPVSPHGMTDRLSYMPYETLKADSMRSAAHDGSGTSSTAPTVASSRARPSPRDSRATPRTCTSRVTTASGGPTFALLPLDGATPTTIRRRAIPTRRARLVNEQTTRPSRG